MSSKAGEVATFKGVQGVAVLNDREELFRNTENNGIVDSEGGPLLSERRGEGSDCFEILLVDEEEKTSFEDGLLGDTRLAGGLAGSFKGRLIPAFEESLKDFFCRGRYTLLRSWAGRILLSESRMS